MFLEVTLTNGQNYSVPIEEGHSLQDEIGLFLERQIRGRLGSPPKGWQGAIRPLRAHHSR